MTEARANAISCTALLAVYAFSRIAYYMAGIRFDMGPLDYFFQYLDPAILRNDLFEGLLYLHSQPVLFNAFLGLVLKTGCEGFLFPAIFIFLGLITVFSVYWIAVFLGINRGIIVIVLSVFICNPSFIAYENHLFYTWTAASLLTGSIVIMIVFFRSNRYLLLFTYFWLLYVLCGTMGIYHIIYFLLTISFLCICIPSERKVLVVACFVPFLMLSIMYGKNYILYGRFISSSWLGHALMDNYNTIIPRLDLVEMVKKGEISPVSLVRTFSPIDHYFKQPELCYSEMYRNIAAITSEKKSNGYINYNHVCYLLVSDKYIDDFIVLIRKYPYHYLWKMFNGWMIYFFPSSYYEQFGNMIPKMKLINKLYDEFILLKTNIHGNVIYPGLLISLPLSIFFSIVLTFSNKILSYHQKIVVGLIILNILYLTFVTNTLTCCSNNRIRFSIDPLYLVLFCCLIQYAILPILLRMVSIFYKKSNILLHRGNL